MEFFGLTTRRSMLAAAGVAALMTLGAGAFAAPAMAAISDRPAMRAAIRTAFMP